MEMINKKINMLVWFKADNIPVPVKFSIKESNGLHKVNIDNILSAKKENPGGEEVFTYDCQSIEGNKINRFVLRYAVKKCCWYLYKC